MHHTKTRKKVCGTKPYEKSVVFIYLIILRQKSPKNENSPGQKRFCAEGAFAVSQNSRFGAVFYKYSIKSISSFINFKNSGLFFDFIVVRELLYD